MLLGLLAVWCVLVVENEQDIQRQNVRTLVFAPGEHALGYTTVPRLEMVQVGGPRVSLRHILCTTLNFNSPRAVWDCRLPYDVSEVLIDYEVTCENYEKGGKIFYVKSCLLEYSLADNSSLVDFLLTILAAWLILSACVLIVDLGWAMLKILYFLSRTQLQRFILRTPTKISRWFNFERKLTIYEHGLIILMPHMSFETLNSLIGVSESVTIAAACTIRRKIIRRGHLKLNYRIESFPPSIGQLSPLKKLSLSWCVNLTSIPDVLAGLTSLEKINFSWSAITSLPPSIGKLSSLKELSLSPCMKLNRIPDTLAGLTSLEKMHLSNSTIKSLPPSIGRLSSLKVLSLNHCYELKTIPDTLAGLKSLEKMYLYESFVDSLPPSIGQLSSLKELSLRWCTNLKRIPDTLAGLTSLEKMDLSDSAIELLPPSVGQLSSLKELLLRGCKNLTSIPDTLASLPLIRKVDIRYTGIAWPPSDRPSPFADGVVVNV